MNSQAEKREPTVQEIVDKEKGFGAIVFAPSDLRVVNYYVPVIERITLDDHEAYKAQGKYRIHYNGLHRLANAAGVEWLAAETRRTDNRSDKLYVSFQAVGGVRYNDGKIYFVKAEYDLDLEIIEEELKDQYTAKGKSKGHKGEALDRFVNEGVRKEFIQKRKRKLTMAESGAKARVIRAILGLKANYTQQELIGTPFIIVRFILNHQDPDVKQLFLQSAQQSIGGIFGGGSLPQVPEPSAVGDIIELPHEEPEQEPQPEPERPQGEMNGQEIDFQAQGPEEQARTIGDLCRQKNHDQINCAGFSPEKMLECFRYLLNYTPERRTA